VALPRTEQGCAGGVKQLQEPCLQPVHPACSIGSAVFTELITAAQIASSGYLTGFVFLAFLLAVWQR